MRIQSVRGSVLADISFASLAKSSALALLPGLFISACIAGQPPAPPALAENESPARVSDARPTLASAPAIAKTHVTLDANLVLRALSPAAFTLNLTSDHTNNFSDESVALWRELHVTTLRWPGGSDSDSYDFTVAPKGDHRSTADFARLAEKVGANAFVTLNYGSGSPQMGTAFAAYLDGSPTSTKVLGVGKRPADGGKAMVDYDWRTVGYWAHLRGEAPIAKDDGLNHLRANHPAPWGFTYFEAGNEIMASWENDARPSGQKQSPLAYAAFCKQTTELLHAVDPKLRLGIVVVASEDVTWRNKDSAVYKAVVNPATGKQHGGWNALLLSEFKRLGFTPDYLIDHFYPQPEKRENDAKLLSMVAPPSIATDSNGALSWSGRAADYRRMLNEYLGKDGERVTVMNTEHNSVSSNPGKQSTSLVNGLFYADSFGSVTRTEIGGFAWWLARSSATNGTMSQSLYGWRMYGDYGLVGEDGYVYFGDQSAPLPGRSSTTPYPTFFAAKLTTILAKPGDKILDAKSNNKDISAYAARSDSALTLLIINKSPDTTAAVTMSLQHFSPASSGKLFQYGKEQDEAQSKGGAVKLDEQSLTGVAAEFSHDFSPYSMTVLVLTPAGA